VSVTVSADSLVASFTGVIAIAAPVAPAASVTLSVLVDGFYVNVPP
jgi:hypothetical protein